MNGFSYTANEYNSPLFLDCCGLVRKVLRDLKEDFGFEVGPWNQAYMVSILLMCNELLILMCQFI